MTLTWCCCTSPTVTLTVPTASSTLPRPSLLACSRTQSFCQVLVTPIEQGALQKEQLYMSLHSLPAHMLTRTIQCLPLSPGIAEVQQTMCGCLLPLRTLPVLSLRTSQSTCEQVGVQRTTDAALAMAVLLAEPAVATPYGAWLALTPASSAAARPVSTSLLICCSRQLFGVCWFAAAWKSWRTCDGQEASVLSTVQRSTDSRFQVRCSWAISTVICSHESKMTQVQVRKLGRPCATRQRL